MEAQISLEGKANQHPMIEKIQNRILAKIESLSLALEMTGPELSILLTDNEQIQTLNAQWRGEDKATDVLSFPLYEPFQVPKDAPALGDIVISLEYAEYTADKAVHLERMEKALATSIPEWGILEETHFLLIHGLLHLVGYDHEDLDEEKEMKLMEKKLWEAST